MEFILLYNQTKNNTRYTVSRTRMISGIEKYKPVTGVSARAYLKKTNLKTSSFAYFGGFIGQGNISVLIRDIPGDAELLGMVVEVDAADDFNLNINNVPCDYSPSQFDFVPDLDENMTAEQWDIMNCNQSILLGDDNAFEFVMPNNINTSYIAGGFVKVTYLTEQTDRNVNTGSSRYYLPGIVGFVNLYDSFYVPGTLHNLSLHLHFKNNYTSNFTIGNVTVAGIHGDEN